MNKLSTYTFTVLKIYVEFPDEFVEIGLRELQNLPKFIHRSCTAVIFLQNDETILQHTRNAPNTLRRHQGDIF